MRCHSIPSVKVSRSTLLLKIKAQVFNNIITVVRGLDVSQWAHDVGSTLKLG